MSYDGSVKFIYTCKETQPYRGVDSSFPELLPDETVTIEIPCYDLNVHQYFHAFRKFLGALGFCEKVILDGAFHFVFTDSNTKEVVDKLMEEYDIQDKQSPYLSFDETDVIRDFLSGKKTCLDEIKDERIRETLNLVTENVPAVRDIKWEKTYYEYRKNAEAEIRDLKAKLSRCENPNAPDYTEEEIEAMTAEATDGGYKPWGDYVLEEFKSTINNQVVLDTLKNADVVCKECGSKYGHYSVSCSSTWEGECDVCGQQKPVTEVRDWNYLKEGIDKLSK